MACKWWFADPGTTTILGSNRSMGTALGKTQAQSHSRARKGQLGAHCVMELPTRPTSEYTLAELGCALSEVTGGSLRRAADLTRAALTELGFIGGVLDTITAGTLGLPRTFLGDKRIVAALEGDDLRDSEYDILFPRAEARCVMAWGLTLGVGLGHFVPEGSTLKPPEPTAPLLAIEQEDGTFLVDPAPYAGGADVGLNNTPSLAAWDPRWLRAQWEPCGLKWFLLTAQGEIEIHPGDGEWILFTPYRKHNPWDFAPWKSLVLAFIMMRDAMFDRARHVEMLAPVRIGVCPQDSDEPQRVKFKDQIDAMQRFPYFVLPPGFDYKVVESASRVADIYQHMGDAAKSDVMVRLTGSEVMVEGSPGFAKGDFQQRVAASLRQFYANAWSDCARLQGLAWWTLENYGPAFATPRVAYNTDPPEDQDAEIKRYGELGRSLVELATGFDRHGFDIDSETIQAIAQRNKIKLRAKPAGPARADEVFAYDLEAGIVQRNEQRARKGLPPLADGNETVPEYRLRIGAPSASSPEPATEGAE